jgi:hypothetical protein
MSGGPTGSHRATDYDGSMTLSWCPGSPRHPGSIAAIAVALLLAACTTGSPTPASSVTTSARASDASGQPPSAHGSPGSAGSPVLASQTDSDWGRIWDRLPVGFPIYPGAVPAEEAQTGPVSGIFTIEGQEARGIAAWMQNELERSAYRTESLNGPLEDGGFVLESVREAGCRIEIVVAPLGGLTTLTVRYGASCPSP